MHEQFLLAPIGFIAIAPTMIQVIYFCVLSFPILVQLLKFQFMFIFLSTIMNMRVCLDKATIIVLHADMIFIT
jgi:hypothetical protein